MVERKAEVRHHCWYHIFITLRRLLRSVSSIVCSGAEHFDDVIEMREQFSCFFFSMVSVSSLG